MADLKISQLTAATTPLAGTEIVPIVQSSTTKQVSVANLTASRAVTAASLSINGASLGGYNLAVTGDGKVSASFKVGTDLQWGAGGYLRQDANDSYIDSAADTYLRTNGTTTIMKLAATGNVSITQAGKGIVLKSPDGNTTKTITIDNAGNLVVS